MIRFICFIILLSPIYGFSQLQGKVVGQQNTKKEPIYGAKIRSLSSGRATSTNEEGEFSIVLNKNNQDTLLVSALGYITDTFVVDKSFRFARVEIRLLPLGTLPDVVVAAKRDNHGIAKLKTLQVEVINEGELRKAACCNLSEAFETNASVDVNMTDAVSGSKKIQMLGLDGIYTQFQLENLPFLRGLESAYGMNAIPGTWIESIQITKGTGSVVNGHESMAGSINLEVKKPENMEQFYFNAYAGSFGRGEINTHSGFKVNERLKGAVFVHAASVLGEIDRNKDGFRDVPKSTTVSVLNRWRYDGKKMEAQCGFSAYTDEKLGGQSGFRLGDNSGRFGVHVDNRHLEAFAKTGFFFSKKPYQSVGVLYNAKWHTTSALFGNRLFQGEERRASVQALFDGIIGNTNHGIKLGTTATYNFIHQRMENIVLPREEVIVGAFGEYTYKGTRYTQVLGLRGDYHSLSKFYLLPRLHGKYAVTEYLDWRFTAGRAFRVPNIMIDNIYLMATGRQWLIEGPVTPEISWNVGTSLVQDFSFRTRKANLTADIYYTYFEQQLIADRDVDMNSIVFRNVAGSSYATAFQVELSLPLLKRFEWRLAYKFLDVKAELAGEIQEQVMIPRHRIFTNLAYVTRNKRWEYDFTLTVFGPSRLHMVAYPDGTLSLDNFSKAFPLANAQVTHVYKQWDIYLGGENIFNYILKDAIVDAQNPFGATFDATRVWAPVQGVMIYAGVRFKIKQNKQ